MVRVFAPATSANLNVGFDILGVALRPLPRPAGELCPSALGDIVSLEAAEADSFSVTGPWAGAIGGPNVVPRALARVRELSGRAEPAAVVLHKGMPVGSGLGSSAASAVAAVAACDDFYGKPLDPEGRLALMGELEAGLSGGLHWDNLVPCALGGLRLGRAALPTPRGWLWLVAYPGLRLETRRMRAVLPEAVPLHDAVEQAGRLGAFVDALHRGEGRAAAALMVDPFAEPRRAPLIPGFDAVKRALLAAGALAAGISGSGPTVFALFDDRSAALAALPAAEAWARSGGASLGPSGEAPGGGFALLCETDERGARVLGPGEEA